MKPNLNQETDMPLYEVAIIKQPTDEERKQGKMEELILGPTPVIGLNDKGAAIQAASELPPEKKKDLARAEVLVRPFSK